MDTSLENASQLFLGIDLGTSRTTIMSNRGAKELVRSVVGYPRDIIGVKLLNRTSAIGEEALEKRSYMNLYHPLEDGVLKEDEKHIQAARELIQHAISLAGPRPGDQVCGILGVPARASITSRNQLLQIAEELMDISLVVSEPFMVAYGLGKLNNAIIIDIGAGTIDLCAMKGNIPGAADQATLLKGGDHIDEFLANAISESYPDVQITKVLARKIKDQYGFVGEAKEEAIVTLRASGKPAPHDVTQEVRAACETIVPDILDSLEKLIQTFDPEDQDEAVSNIILAGGGSNIVGLDVALASRLKDYGNVNVSRVADSDYAGCAGALKLATELPPEYWSQVGDVVGS
ncbi:MAG: rod shape-determining protein [Magnetococcales bacterium]|nr:rod shape-determining protein [Magnetococcales bacterium]